MDAVTDSVNADSKTLQAAYRDCHAIARKAARNFYYAFLILPKHQRLAMCALYTFMRFTDDIGDGTMSVERRRESLADWRTQLAAALEGVPLPERWWFALADTAKRFAIPPELLCEVIDGVESDLTVSRYESFDDLYRYCYRVASAVGLSCIRVWGATDPRADLPAEHCGIAFQLTNIIRDIVEDHERGRVYLPADELDRFGLTAETLLDAGCRKEAVELVRFQIERAHHYYDRAEILHDDLPASGKAVFRVLVDIYRGLLRKIERRPAAVFEKRVRLHSMTKVAALASAWPRRYLSLPVSHRDRSA